MGNDYSFVLNVPQERVWDVLQAVAAMQSRNGDEIDLIFPDHKLTLPFSSRFETQPIHIDESVQSLSFDTSLCFELDEVLEEDIEGLIEYESRLGESVTREDYLDEQGRRAIGFIYLSVDFRGNRSSSEHQDAKPVARFTFTAATGRMSDLFEQSPSMQQAFVELAVAHQGELCFLDREEKPSILLYLEGERLKEELPFIYSALGYYAPDVIRAVLRGKQIEGELRKGEETTPRLELLSQNLQDSDPVVRAIAISTFGEDTPGSGPLLFKALGDEDRMVRLRAALALDKRKERSAVPLMINLLQDADADVRWAACVALGGLKDKSAVEPLISRLQDNDSRVRKAAVESLGVLRDRRAVEPLVSSLQDNDSGVRDAAVKSLGALRDRRAVEPLIRALQSDDDDIRLSVIVALEHLRDRRAVEPLCQRLAVETGGKKIFIAIALGAIKDKAAIPALSSLLEEGGLTASHAVEALGKIREPEAAEILRRYLDDRDWGVEDGVRNDAEKALRKISKHLKQVPSD